MSVDTASRELLAAAMTSVGDPGPVVVQHGKVAWTETYVYFPTTRDGAEWLASARRDLFPAGTWDFLAGV